MVYTHTKLSHLQELKCLCRLGHVGGCQNERADWLVSRKNSEVDQGGMLIMANNNYNVKDIAFKLVNF